MGEGGLPGGHAQAGLTRAIKEQARELGFDLVGVAPAGPAATGQAYLEWLQHGFAGEMAYMARQVERRMDLAQLLPGACSVIVAGMNYYAELAADSDPVAGLPDHSPGVIARYAWGGDYHGLIKERLQSLLERIKGLAGPETRGKVYVDTGPVLERDLAQRAGLGWFGKHTNLISRSLGSYLFLGEILLNLQLVPDRPAADHCGTCNRCLVACPTAAIVAPYRVDARRCIAYLTIELQGPIPRELRPLIGTTIFGCDICQEVCPWNRFARASQEEGFQPKRALLEKELIELLQLDEDGFRQLFKLSPIRRAKRRGLLRNVAVALGNLRQRRAVPALCNALLDPEPLVRGHAAWALGQIGGEEVWGALEGSAAREEEAWVREEIAAALALGRRVNVALA